MTSQPLRHIVADYNQDGVIDTTDIFELMYYLAMRGAGVLVEDPENDEDD